MVGVGDLHHFRNSCLDQRTWAQELHGQTSKPWNHLCRLKKEEDGEGERKMGRGRWGEEDGERKMGRGRWGEGDGEREMGRGRWGEGDGEREMGEGDGEREMGRGRWGEGDGERKMGRGRRGERRFTLAVCMHCSLIPRPHPALAASDKRPGNEDAVTKQL